MPPSRENTDGVLRPPSVFSRRFSVKTNKLIFDRPIVVDVVFKHVVHRRVQRKRRSIAVHFPGFVIRRAMLNRPSECDDAIMRASVSIK